MKHEKLVGPSVGLGLIGGSCASSDYLREIGNQSLARLPDGSSYHKFVFSSGINLAFTQPFDGTEVDQLARFHARIAQIHGGRPAIAIGHSFGATLARSASRLNPSVVGAVVELVPPIGTDFEDKRPLPEGIDSHHVRILFDANPPPFFQPIITPKTTRTVLGIGGHIGAFMFGDGVDAAVDAVVDAYTGCIREETVYQATSRS